MARYERDPRATAGGPPTPDGKPKVTMRLGADGRYAPVRPEGEPTVAETRAAERPEQPDDPRSALLRNVPPYGAV